MKLRILNNSLRLRLTKTEVSQLNNEKFIKGEVNFFPFNFTYNIESKKEINEPQVNMFINGGSQHSLVITIGDQDLQEWANTNTIISLKYVVKNNKDEHLKLLIEKDFKCLIDRPDENEEDNFPNPLAGLKE